MDLTIDPNLVEEVNKDEICDGDGPFVEEDLTYLFSICQTFTTRDDLLIWMVVELKASEGEVVDWPGPFPVSNNPKV
ncbi:hypothetical protein L6164_016784 [Bauhinia variegata]|uniref:Uncharacterized protein n=1 Tax=Bauhinia variegata TaxID=167791 RepID=A0ACB9N5N2_BAUVA|nr:hypothetical protein L6164_016784 [Bauhinia variegata]